MNYPQVIGELETLDQVVAGRSLARFGDSELANVEGLSSASQPVHLTLSRRLGQILKGDSGACLVGIPNLCANIERPYFWDGYHARFTKFLHPDVAYASAFVSRPDITPWANIPSYWHNIESLWKGQDVTLVRGSDPLPQPNDPTRFSGAVSLLASDMTSAKSVREIVAPAFDAWPNYESIMAEIGTPKRVLICLGATATVMAVDLCARGVHAVDLGHLGLFLRRHRAGEPMKRSKRRQVA